MKIYSFLDVKSCNMCGHSSDVHKRMGLRYAGSQGKTPHKKIGIFLTIMKCTNCGLIFPNPIPIPQNFDDHYGVPPEEYWQTEYYYLDPSYFNSVISNFNRIGKSTLEKRSLDIGAGLGIAMKALELAGFEAHGIEPSKPFYDRAIEKMQISGDRLQLAPIENAEFPDEFFDFITFGAVLEHLFDPNEAIRKALKWLKPDGIIHIEVPSSDWLTHKIINFYYKIRGLDSVANLSPMHEPYHLFEFSLKSFQLNGSILGYEIAHHEYIVCETFLPKQLDFILKPYMAKTNKGMQLCVYLRKLC